MTATVPLTRGMVAVVDDDDLEHVLGVGEWHAADCDGRWYARHWYRDQFDIAHTISLHTYLTGWRYVDHVNGDGLDNRRENLRPATGTQNNANTGLSAANTSGFKGVSLYRRTGRWRAYVGTAGREQHLGYFDTAEEAARAYDVAAIQQFGPFAKLNFPKE